MKHQSPFTTRDNWMFTIGVVSAAILVASLVSIFYVLNSLFGGGV